MMLSQISVRDEITTIVYELEYWISIRWKLTGQVEIKAVLFISLLLFTNDVFDSICHLDVGESIWWNHQLRIRWSHDFNQLEFLLSCLSLSALLSNQRKESLFTRICFVSLFFKSMISFFYKVHFSFLLFRHTLTAKLFFYFSMTFYATSNFHIQLFSSLCLYIHAL